METGDQEGRTELQMLSKDELCKLLMERVQQTQQLRLMNERIQQLMLMNDRNVFFHCFKDRNKRPKSLAELEQAFEKLNYPCDMYEPALSKYTQLSTKGSISYPRASALSLSALNACSDCLNMSLFHREQLADRENDFCLSRAQLSNEAIRLIVCREFFSDDNDALDQFMVSNCARLVRIRTMYAYEESRNTITEENHLQPAAQLFFHTLASQLPPYTCCIPANDIELAFDAKFNEVAQGKKKGKAKEGVAERKQEDEATIVAVKQVQGASDLLFCVGSTTTEIDALQYGRALVELKTPFNVLLSEVAAYGQKDQTAAEIAGFIQRRRVVLENDMENTVFVGALTDLFSLHLFCGEMLPSDESDEEDKFSLLISDRVVSEHDYVLRILYLLVLGREKCMFYSETVVKESVQPEPIDPGYYGDDGNSDGGSADDESDTEKTEEGGRQSAAWQAGSKRRSAIACVGGGERKRKRALSLSVMSAALSHEEQNELERIYEDARRTRHLIACGDAIAYLGAQELETWKSLTTAERRRARLL